MNAKAVAFIPARLTSTRLPQKHLKQIGDRSLISWVIKRCRDANIFNQIVVCAPDEIHSNALIDVCKSEGVELFLYEGDVNDVVGRLTNAAILHQAEICVLASGDCPLLSPSSMELLVSEIKNSSKAAIALVGPRDRKIPIHEGFFAMRRSVWERANELSNTPELREHQFPIVFNKPDLFKDFKAVYPVDEEIFYSLSHRISIDTPLDLQFHRELFRELTVNGLDYNLKNAIQYVCDIPSMLEINNSVKQKSVFETSRSVAFYVSAVSDFGYGNLMRSISVANELVCRHSVSSVFYVFDEIAKNYLDSQGFKSLVVDCEAGLVSLELDHDALVVDVNSSFILDAKELEACKEYMKVIVLDNVNQWSLSAHEIIVPNAHYVGMAFENLVSGHEYIVIRDEVKKSQNNTRSETDYGVAYSGYAEFWGKLTEVIDAFPEMSQLPIHRYTSFDDGFINILSQAKHFFSPLSVSAYESIFLGVTPHVIPMGGDENEVKQFQRFLSSGGEIDGRGAERIAGRIWNQIASQNARG